MNYYVCISDRLIEINSTTIKRIELADSTDKTILQTNTATVVNGTTVSYSYKIGLMGDVNNDGVVNAKDVSSIQKYASGLITLTNEDLIVADTSGDGRVTTNDATIIQKYLAEITEELPNGKVALLS